MLLTSDFNEELDIASTIDDIIETSVFDGFNESLDPKTLKLLEEIEMTATMNSVTTQEMLGTLNTGDDNTFEATFTPEGSSAISAMSYNGDTLSVTFRGREDAYEYMLSDEALGDIIDELYATLVDAEGSVGSLVNRMIRNNQLKLV
jgi:hypothetical protein